MTISSIILFIHVIATLGIVVAMGDESTALRQMIAASEKGILGIRFERLPSSRMFSSTCLLILFFSGGYLTERLSMWSLGWPKVAVAVVLLFGALAGISAGVCAASVMSIRVRTAGCRAGQATKCFCGSPSP